MARVAGKCTLSEHFATLNVFNVGLPNKKEKWVLEGQLLSLQVSCNQQEKVYSERILGVGWSEGEEELMYLLLGKLNMVRCWS